jgi:hypothetical protein
MSEPTPDERRRIYDKVRTLAHAKEGWGAYYALLVAEYPLKFVEWAGLNPRMRPTLDDIQYWSDVFSASTEPPPTPAHLERARCIACGAVWPCAEAWKTWTYGPVHLPRTPEGVPRPK